MDEDRIELTWELTRGSEAAGHGELSTAECVALLDEFADVGVRSVGIGGGEPTLRADFWMLLERAASRRLAVAFRTNGIGVTPAAARQLATRFR
ncbi:radical SAM protein [Nocardia farcinica]|uniref:radical SAM protein n=1 Tax=Nocardia farcinica TaxID=37329 RepID=UPI003794FA8C